MVDFFSDSFSGQAVVLLKTNQVYVSFYLKNYLKKQEKNYIENKEYTRFRFIVTNPGYTYLKAHH